MQSDIQKLALEQVANFPKLFLDYLQDKEDLKNVYGRFPHIDNFKDQIKSKSFQHRATLVQVLKEQYAHLPSAPNLDILQQENTFTVTTGHQLNIFTGPLYVIYKIVSTINLAKVLSQKYPDYNFVPVYWMATEDHDFEEIASFFLFGTTYTWNTDQKGAVGEMDPSGLREILDQLREKPAVFEKAYTENATLADAVRQYMHELFGQQGLVSIDGNHPALKQIFAPVVLEELQTQVVKGKLEENASLLEQLGYKTLINPREINLFYKTPGVRERIDYKDGIYTVLGTDMRFTLEEIKEELAQFPERFSPNVALRPLYEEMILPNLAYLGGPSELAYWLQLKGVFDHFKVTFPILLPRNLGLLVTESLKKRLDKLNVSVEELYQDDVKLRKAFVDKHSENSLDLETEVSALEQVFADILEKAERIDPTLKGAIEAEKVKTVKGLGNLEARLKKAEERKFDTSIQQLLTVKDKLFPGGSQQERKDNFLNYALNDPQFLDKLFAAFDPLDFRFNVIYL